jgi:superfamily II DNA helicase RecQ
VDACLAHELLVTRTDEGKYPKVDLTPLGIEVLVDRTAVPVCLDRPRAAPIERAAPASKRTGRGDKRGKRKRGAKAAPSGPVDEGLLKALRGWRRERANEDGVPAFMIFPDATLEAIAAARPRDLAALLLVPGLGPKKVERFGAAVLPIISGTSLT